MVWHCKDIKLNGTLQDEQVGVLIIKWKGSTLAKLRNHDLVTTPTQDSFNGFSELIHWCVAMYSKNPLIRNHILRNHRLFFLL